MNNLPPKVTMQTKTKTKTTVTLGTKLLVSLGILGATGALLAIAPLPCIDCKKLPPPAPLTITTQSPLPSAEENENYHFQLQATGGTAPYNWGMSSGDLPIGLYLNYDGMLSGQPNTVNCSECHFTVVVQDAKGTNVTRDFDLRVKASNLFRINSTNPLPPAVVGVPYRYDFSTTPHNSVGPLTWTKLSGDVPAGWLVNNNATLLKNSPQATEVGFYRFTMQVVEGKLGDADKETFYLNVLPAGSLTITTQSPLPSAEENENYHFQLQATGGTAPYNWGMSSGDLPIGLYLNYDGTLSGQPNTVNCSECHFTVMMEDAKGTMVTRDFNLQVKTTKVLSVSKLGTGVGIVTSYPSGINCGSDCEEEYPIYARVTLTAIPATGSKFTGWSGACSGTSTCIVTMNAVKSVTANFVKVITSKLPLVD